MPVIWPAGTDRAEPLLVRCRNDVRPANTPQRGCVQAVEHTQDRCQDRAVLRPANDVQQTRTRNQYTYVALGSHGRVRTGWHSRHRRPTGRGWSADGASRCASVASGWCVRAHRQGHLADTEGGTGGQLFLALVSDLPYPAWQTARGPRTARRLAEGARGCAPTTLPTGL